VEARRWTATYLYLDHAGAQEARRYPAFIIC
jgi:hypothetical protein